MTGTDTHGSPPFTGRGMEAWDRHLRTRRIAFGAIGTIGVFISVWRAASGDVQDAVFGLGIGLWFWYRALLKTRA